MYLIDGRFKTVVVDANLDAQTCCKLLAEKLTLSPTDNFNGYYMFEALDYGRGNYLPLLSSEISFCLFALFLLQI